MQILKIAKRKHQNMFSLFLTKPRFLKCVVCVYVNNENYHFLIGKIIEYRNFTIIPIYINTIINEGDEIRILFNYGY